jgi:hypothetical protein
MIGRDLTPREGARYLLEREGAGDAGPTAHYRLAIFTPTARFDGAATLDDHGEVTVVVADADAELVAAATMFARLTARGAAKRREDGLPAWPARVLRWRGPGRGT